jgi:hypothetical protein
MGPSPAGILVSQHAVGGGSLRREEFEPVLPGVPPVARCSISAWIFLPVPRMKSFLEVRPSKLHPEGIVPLDAIDERHEQTRLPDFRGCPVVMNKIRTCAPPTPFAVSLMRKRGA